MLFNLAYVRETLWPYAGNQVAYSQSTQAQKDDADDRINQVSERILGDGKYKNTLRRIILPIEDEYIVLPRELGTILGIKLISDSGCCFTSQIYSKFHEFAQGISCCAMGTYPISETAQTFTVPTAPFTLRVKGTAAEGNMKIIGGWDEDENQIFSTDTIAITNGTTNGTLTYSSLPPTGGIQKPETTVPVELYSVDSDGVETLIAIYAPYETIPSYKKYKIPNCSGQFTSALVFGKITYVPAIADTDIVIPSNLGALKMGLNALQAEDTKERDQARSDWQECFEILDREVTEAEGDNEYPIFKVAPAFACSGIYPVI
jgi:hypothetical protein